MFSLLSLIGSAALAASTYVVPIDLCKAYPEVLVQSGPAGTVQSLNTAARLADKCEDGTEIQYFDLCQPSPRIVTKTGLVLNTLARDLEICS